MPYDRYAPELTDMDGHVYGIMDKEARETIAGLGQQYADRICNTVENQAIASFQDGADGVPVKELTVAIEPVQDLHG